MTGKVPKLFSDLDIEALKEIAKGWVEKYLTIKRITLYPYPKTWQRSRDEQYVIIFEVTDPRDAEKWGWEFAQALANNEFYGPEFLKVYKEYSSIKNKEELADSLNIPWRFSDQWHISVLESGNKKSMKISSHISVQLYPGTYQEQKEDSEKKLLDCIENALIPVEKLWEAILEKLHNSGELLKSITPTQLSQSATEIFNEKEHEPIKLEYLDRKLFSFSQTRRTKEKEDYEKRLMRKIVKDKLKMSVTENKCYQLIKEIREPMTPEK